MVVAGKLPSLKGVAEQINALKQELRLEKVFLATDAPNSGKGWGNGLTYLPYCVCY